MLWDAAHAARKSAHNPNIEGFARAYDYDEDVTEGLGEQELKGMALVLLGDKRTKLLIYEAQLLYPDGTVKPYTGINAHRHHLHHEIHDWAVLDRSPWGIARAFHAAPPPPEEDDMPLNDTDKAWLQAAIDQAVATAVAETRKVPGWVAGEGSEATLEDVIGEVRKVPSWTADELEKRA